jgi:hypothetical protein
MRGVCLKNKIKNFLLAFAAGGWLALVPGDVDVPRMEPVPIALSQSFVEEAKKKALASLLVHHDEKEIKDFFERRGFKIIVEKSSYRLSLLDGDKVVAQYPIARGPVEGDKKRMGDLKTPEGIFELENAVGEQKYGWSVWMPLKTVERAKKDFLDSYGDKARKLLEEFEARKGKITSDEHVKAFNEWAPKSYRIWRGVGIHGGSKNLAGNGNRNWTAGCVALENEHALQLKRALQASERGAKRTPVLFLP